MSFKIGNDQLGQLLCMLGKQMQQGNSCGHGGGMSSFRNTMSNCGSGHSSHGPSRGGDNCGSSHGGGRSERRHESRGHDCRPQPAPQHCDHGGRNERRDDRCEQKQAPRHQESRGHDCRPQPREERCEPKRENHCAPKQQNHCEPKREERCEPKRENHCAPKQQNHCEPKREERCESKQAPRHHESRRDDRCESKGGSNHGNHGAGRGGDNHGAGRGGSNHGAGRGGDNHGAGRGGDNHGAGRGGDNHGAGRGGDNHGAGRGGNNHGAGRGGDNHGAGRGDWGRGGNNHGANGGDRGHGNQGGGRNQDLNWSVGEIKDGKGQIKLGDRYTIDLNEPCAQWVLTDKDGNKTTVWGDPHVTPSAGGGFDFAKNSTFQLEDGTKITVGTTNQTSVGASYSSSLTITNGNNAIKVTGLASSIDGANNLAVTQSKTQGRQIDRQTDDGAFTAKKNGGSWTIDGQAATSAIVKQKEAAKA